MENEDPWNSVPRPDEDAPNSPQSDTPADAESPQAPADPWQPATPTGPGAGSGDDTSTNWAFAPIDGTQAHQTAQSSAVWTPDGPSYGTSSSTTGANKGKAGRVILAVVVLVALSLGSGAAGAAIAHKDNPKTTTIGATPVSVAGGTTTSTQQLAKVAAAVQPSVVSITVVTRSAEDEGSGIILNADGTILTNNHVVEAAATSGTITVKFSNGKTSDAKIIGRDPSADVAVIKASNAAGLTPATIGSTSSLHVGDTVLAIGSPLGLDGSVTSGIVSALHRTVDLSSDQQQDQGGNGLFGQQQQQAASTSVGDAIQTDAAINPGNSGGALVDIDGHVVGINTAIASTGSTNGNIGVGFAIPIEEAKSVATQLIAGQTPKHALLGVEIDDQNTGAVVADVTSGGAADAAGIQVGDIITKVDSVGVDDGTALAATIRSHQPGDKVTLTYTRNGSEKTATATLGQAAS